MEITSKTNTKVKQWMKYHQKKYRDQDEMFLVEGEHLIEEALKAQQVKCLMLRKGSVNPFTFNGEIYVLANDVMDKLSTNVSKVNYIALCEKKVSLLQELDRVLILDDVQDPGNMGTLIRSAHSFGYQAVFISKNCVDLYNEKTIRSTQGALFYVPVIQCDIKEKIAELQKDEFYVIATALQNALPLSEVRMQKKMAIVLGNEGQGIHTDVISLCDVSVKIEMHSFESLNVAVAGGICMYQFSIK